MGGNALKTINTVRLPAEAFFKLEKWVIDVLKKTGLRVSAIPAYTDKKTYGDLDVMIEYRHGIDYMEIVNCFNPTEVFRNGKVISFDVENFQVDLIITRPEFFDFSLGYYSYNDLGNLMGRVAHKLGLKYGHEGLYYTFRENNENIIGKILLTQDSRTAFDFLDYDLDRFLDGFKNLNEIFEYVVSTKYFNPDIFSFDNRNYKARVRDSKRPTYTAFLKYCEENDFTGCYQFEDKNNYLSMIASSFPHFMDERAELQDAVNRKNAIASKFNGNLVMNHSSLRGKELGAFMTKCRTDEFEDWVLKHSPEEVEKKVIELLMTV